MRLYFQTWRAILSQPRDFFKLIENEKDLKISLFFFGTTLALSAIIFCARALYVLEYPFSDWLLYNFHQWEEFIFPDWELIGTFIAIGFLGGYGLLFLEAALIHGFLRLEGITGRSIRTTLVALGYAGAPVLLGALSYLFTHLAFTRAWMLAAAAFILWLQMVGLANTQRIAFRQSALAVILSVAVLWASYLSLGVPAAKMIIKAP